MGGGGRGYKGRYLRKGREDKGRYLRKGRGDGEPMGAGVGEAGVWRIAERGADGARMRGWSKDERL